MSDRGGLPLTVAISAANTHDSHALKPLVMAIPAVKSRRGPRRGRPAKLHADKAYDQRALRHWVRTQGICVRIARKGIESAEKLGKHRWVIERTIAWLTGCRRLTLRYERKAAHFLAFLQLAAAVTCWKKNSENLPHETISYARPRSTNPARTAHPWPADPTAPAHPTSPQ
ncbi:transposase [Saccharomonospora amisosensis]|uniref:Transposase n=1 Tax=Saccharomonospora amisosensis TaxID=1128677 RepID=A0A7X5UN99_9PSEU|nr:transposase [Saccharomonospora amisosensis]